MPEHTLLVLTVGGSPEPIAVALKHWRPARVVFVPSRETRPAVQAALDLAAAAGAAVAPGVYDVQPVGDAQDLTACLRTLQRLDMEVRRWIGRGPEYAVAVDYTGGTKTMSAALALWARRWPCQISYVGGTERTREGVGVVVAGSEHTVVTDNPWDTLGYQAAEDACAAFDAGDFRAAAALLEEARRSTQDMRVKRELSALLEVVEAYSLWDRFRHQDAAARLERLAAVENDLHAVLGADAADDLLERAGEHQAHLRQLVGPGQATMTLVVDLLANARRRAREGRFDDAVARLYRATEALAQIRLRDRYGLSTDAVPLKAIPDALREPWKGKAKDEMLKLGLQDVFELLRQLGDPLGERFTELGLAERKSPLAARNRSVLAHGWQPISQKDHDALWTKVLALAGCAEDELPQFPRLARKDDE
jgi:CRISPR-associated protein (TIGR02710 family)